MKSLLGQSVGTYCASLWISAYAKVRLMELHTLKEHTYHHGRWIHRARQAVIHEVSGSIVAAWEPTSGRQTTYVVDLATGRLLTAFRYKKGQRYLDLDGSMV